MQNLLIITHDGRYHCDDVVAVALAKIVYPTALVLRTRDPLKLSVADILIDVGGVYAPERMRFDHHQRDFDVHYSDKYPQTKMSSAGMVWKALGRELICNMFSLWTPMKDSCTDESRRDAMHELFYARFLLPIDAFDNGVQATEERPLYSDITSLGARIARMNRTSSFSAAVELATLEIRDFLNYLHSYVMPNFGELAFAVVCSGETDPIGCRLRRNGTSISGCIEISHDVEWESVFEDVQRKHPEAADIYYVLYSHTDHYRVKCVPDYTKPMFASRKQFPEHWAGLEGQALEAACGVDGAIFCHNGRFLCANKTREGAISMVKIALSQ